MKRMIVASTEYTTSNPPPGWEIRNLDGVDTWIDVKRYEVSRESYDKLKSDFASDINRLIGYDLLTGPTYRSGISVEKDGTNYSIKYKLTFKSSLNRADESDKSWRNYYVGDVRISFDGDHGIVGKADNSGNVRIEADLPVGVTTDEDPWFIKYAFNHYGVDRDHMENIQNFYERILKNFKSGTKRVFDVNRSVESTQSFVDKLTNCLNDDRLWSNLFSSINCPIKFLYRRYKEFRVDYEEDYSLANFSSVEFYNSFFAYDYSYALTGGNKTQKFRLKCAPIDVTCYISSEREKCKSWEHAGEYCSTLNVTISIPTYYESNEISEAISKELGDANTWSKRICDWVARYINVHCKQVGQYSKKVPRSELDFDEWFNGYQYVEESNEFVENVTTKLEKKYPGCDVFEEPSTQGMMGGDFWTITMQDGTRYSVEFNYEDEVETLCALGPKRAATQYFNEIVSQIKSGKVSVVED